MAEIKDLVEPLSDKLQPPRLREGEKAVFRLLAIGKKEPGREEPSAPEVYQMAAQETVIDALDPKGPRRKVMGTVITEYKIMNGVQVPVYKKPQFIKGWCVVPADDHEIYVRLIRSLKCRNNKFRGAMGGGRVKPVFEFVEDSTKEVHDQLNLADLRFHAESIVRTSSVLERKSIATQLRTSPDDRLHTKSFIPGVKENDLQGLILELIHIAQLYPKQVISASGNQEAVARVNVFEFMRMGILIYEDGAYQVMGKGKLNEVFRPSVDKDPVDDLVQFFISEEGKEDYVTLVNQLKKMLAPKA